MSFSTDIKHEIASDSTLKECCKRAELSALIQLTSSIKIARGAIALSIRTENAISAKRIMILLKERYPKIDIELEVMKKTNLRKNNVYNMTVWGMANEILSDLGLYNTKGLLLEHPLYHIIQKDCCAKSYLAGAFLAFGSCNSPKKSNYHLEISLMSVSHAQFIIKLLNRFYIEAKMMKRRNKYVVYVKKAESIADFLRCVGASEALMAFEDVRIARDAINSITKVNNCDIANEVKVIKAGQRQIADIESILKNGRYPHLSDKLKEVVDIRREFPDHSLKDLAAEYEKKTGEAISKSGLKHRFDKIHEIAKELE